nr:DUF2442 domain-containing protein [uncultured Anaeromusa sp.]
MKISKVTPSENYCLTVVFENAQTVTLDMKGKLQTLRFSSLRNEQVFRAVKADEKSLYWPGDISMAVSEIRELSVKQAEENKDVLRR